MICSEIIHTLFSKTESLEALFILVYFTLILIMFKVEYLKFVKTPISINYNGKLYSGNATLTYSSGDRTMRNMKLSAVSVGDFIVFNVEGKPKKRIVCKCFKICVPPGKKKLNEIIIYQIQMLNKRRSVLTRYKKEYHKSMSLRIDPDNGEHISYKTFENLVRERFSWNDIEKSQTYITVFSKLNGKFGFNYKNNKEEGMKNCDENRLFNASSDNDREKILNQILKGLYVRVEVEPVDKYIYITFTVMSKPANLPDLGIEQKDINIVKFIDDGERQTIFVNEIYGYLHVFTRKKAKENMWINSVFDDTGNFEKMINELLGELNFSIRIFTEQNKIKIKFL